MTVYIILYFVVLVGILYPRNDKIGYFVWAVLLFFSAFRGESVGTDTASYLDVDYAYNRATMDFNFGLPSSYEITTNLIYRVFSVELGSFSVVFFFSVGTFIFLFLLSKRTKMSLAILMMVFLLGGGYIYSFNISRQWTAISIVAFATTYIYNSSIRKSLFFFPFILLAGSIHFSSVFCLFLYVFRYIKIRFQYAVTVLGVSLLLFVVFDFSLNPVFSSSSLGNPYVDVYGQLLDERISRSVMNRLFSLIVGLLYVFVILRMNKLKIGYLIPLFLFGVVIGHMSLHMDATICRVFMFFTFLSSVILSKYFSTEKSRDLLVVYFVCFTYKFFVHGLTYEYILGF